MTTSLVRAGFKFFFFPPIIIIISSIVKKALSANMVQILLFESSIGPYESLKIAG